MKHKSQNKIMIVLLALLMFVGVLPLQALAETVVVLPYTVDLVDETTVSEEVVEQTQFREEKLVITLDGEEVTEIELLDYEKIEITAEGLSGDADYQWEIMHPENEGQWVNIYESTEQSLSVTKALISNVLRADGTTMVRCTAVYDEQVFESSPVIISLIETVSDEVYLPTLDNNVNDGIMTVDDTTTETPEFVTITVKYMRYDYLKVNDQYILDTVGVEAFTPYVATILYNDSLKATVQFPTIVGYRSYLDGQAETDTDTSMTINLTNVTKNQEYIVKFVPTDVKYVVLYYFQNIYDDNYVEDASKTVVATGQTGNMPDPDHVQKEFDGFTSMYYQPDTIAADGSTVFEVYYERNYYLMDFDCGGGYGADPVYVRYGTYVSVPDPVRSGWVFQGWDLTGAKDEAGNTLSLKEVNGNLVPYTDTDDDGIDPVPYSDDNVDTLPATMPFYNSAYKAIWGRSPTTFTVVYWVQNANDDAYSYAYSIENVQATTGDVINLDTISNYYTDSTNTIRISTELPDDNLLKHYSKIDEATTTNHYDKDSNGNTIVYTLDGGGTASGVQLEGDHSSVFNIYFKRNEYTLRFVYARSNGTVYQLARYASNYWGDLNASDINWITLSTNTTTPPTISLPNDSRFKSGSTNEYSSTYTYYYFDVTARYRQDISNLWPTSDAPNSSPIVNRFTDNSTTYMCLGWIVSPYSGFGLNDRVNGRHIISGVYEILDDQMLVDSDVTSEQGPNHIILGEWSNIAAGNYLWEYRYFVGITADEYNADKLKPEFNTDNYIKKTDSIVPDSVETTHYYWDYWRLETSYQTYGYSGSSDYPPRSTFEGLMYTARTAADYDVNGDGTISYEKRMTYFYFYNERSLALNNYGDLTEYAPKSSDAQYNSYEEKYILYESATGVDYGVSLDAYLCDSNTKVIITPAYPDTLEPEAYYFAGWYTGLNGSGDRIVFDSSKDTNEKDLVNKIWYNPTMPDDNLILFAYWAPKTWEVSFYYDYNDYLDDDPWEHENADGETVTYPINVTHGNLLGTAHYANPTRIGYNFVGWFYIDDNGKKRFAPESMEIKKELKLFAEWISAEGIATQYTITYVEVDSEGNYVQEIGAKTEGYSTVGKTKTFNAKGSFALNEGFRQGYFPEIASHSILMAPINDDGTTPNTFEFKYVNDPIVYYEIRYVDVATNKTIHDPVVKSTQDAVVTERFLPINGYVPMPGYYYQTKSLATDGDNKETDEVIDSNIITFYYMADTLHGAYSIEYYLEDATGTVSYDGKTYVQKNSITNTADLEVNGSANIIDSNEEFEIVKFDGYNFSSATASNFTVNDSVVTEKVTGTFVANDDHEAFVYGTLDSNGLTIRLYYNKQSFNYTIKYVEYGNATNVIQSETGTALFGDDITRVAPISITTVSGDYYDYYLKGMSDFDEEDETQRTQMMIIRTPVTDNPDTDINEAYNNEMVFYYKQRQMTVYYHAVTKISGAKGYGVVSLQGEMAATADTLTGSNARAGVGYRFVGWFTDEACTETSKVNADWLYIPDEDGKASEQNPNGTMLKPGKLSAENLTVEYYALFEPIETELTISKVGMDSDDHHSIFRVQGLGKLNFIDLTVSIEKNGSATIKNLPVGEYEVTELTEWNWKYSDNPGWSFTDTDNFINGTGKVASIILSTSKGTVQFTNTYLDTDWLSSETNDYYLE